MCQQHVQAPPPPPPQIVENIIERPVEVQKIIKVEVSKHK